MRSFALVGGAASPSRAVILTVLIRFAGWSAVACARALLRPGRAGHLGAEPDTRFPAAACSGARSKRSSTRHPGVGGALINLGDLCGAACTAGRSSASVPVVPLAIGAVGGFGFNFAASNSKWLYARRRARSRRMIAMHCGKRYSGVDNLEVMQEAVNYNRYLLDTRAAPCAVRPARARFRRRRRPVRCAAGAARIGRHRPRADEGLRTRHRGRGVAAVAGPADSSPTATSATSIRSTSWSTSRMTSRRCGSCTRNLRPAGRCSIYVPAFPVLYTSMDAKVGHVRRYTRSSLTAAVSAAGFTIERCRLRRLARLLRYARCSSS